jgi:glycosyltransferase involved in cell wall biosynthesis
MSQHKFTWVSPYRPDDSRGGWKSMQFHLLRALETRLGPARRIAPVDVPEERVGKWVSRLQKRLGIPRRYVHFSDSRLNGFAKVVDTQIPRDDSQPVVFFGPLPFVRCRPKGPYYIYTDGAFFIHYWEYNQDHSHAKADIERIERAEAEFMRGAAGVCCSSQWVVDRVTRNYRLPAGKVRFVGTGPGDVPPPVEPVRYEDFLVMIAADFERKGGWLAVEAVAEARKLGAEIQLKFIGAEPPASVLANPFVEWCGWLDMKKDADRSRFAEVLSKAGAQILLSRNDLTPLAILEAATYSKATVAMAVGGIPEMIREGETGWLVPPASPAAEIGKRLAELFKKKEMLIKAGANACADCTRTWSWQAVAESIATLIYET